VLSVRPVPGSFSAMKPITGADEVISPWGCGGTGNQTGRNPVAGDN
jgi:hypothetical protein